MGYSTDFEGEFRLSKPLTNDQKSYLVMFADTRRMKRDVVKIESIPKIEKNLECLELLEKLKLPLGNEGEYYCGKGMAGQDHDPSILDYNTPPSTQPSLWVQWVPNDDGTAIQWQGSEKFYWYVMNDGDDDE